MDGIFLPVFSGSSLINTLAAAIFCFLLALFFALPGRSLPLIRETADSAGTVKVAPAEDADGAGEAEG
jgi:hypothetical protein